VVVVHHSTHAILKQNNVKVKEKSNRNVQEPEVRKQLGLVNGV
jgi:hypothetical protein